MFKARFVLHVLFLCLVLCVCTVFALDGAVAQATGHGELVAIISAITTAICAVVSYIFGHKHGVKKASK
jgi:Na+-transporting NADH:ubiquinone oxidoreductase subunit NqrE